MTTLEMTTNLQAMINELNANMVSVKAEYKKSHDFQVGRKYSQIDRTISALNQALKEVNALANIK